MKISKITKKARNPGKKMNPKNRVSYNVTQQHGKNTHTDEATSLQHCGNDVFWLYSAYATFGKSS